MAQYPKKKPGVMIYYDVIPVLEKLTYAQVGELVIGLLHYSESGREPNFNEMALKLIWPFFSSKSDKDQKSYAETCIKNKYNAKYRSYKSKARQAGKDPLEFQEWCEAEGLAEDIQREIDQYFN